MTVCDLFRTVQTQCVETERQRIFSPWLLSVVRNGSALARQDEKPVVAHWVQRVTDLSPVVIRGMCGVVRTRSIQWLTTDCGDSCSDFSICSRDRLASRSQLGVCMGCNRFASGA